MVPALPLRSARPPLCHRESWTSSAVGGDAPVAPHAPRSHPRGVFASHSAAVWSGPGPGEAVIWGGPSLPHTTHHAAPPTRSRCRLGSATGRSWTDFPHRRLPLRTAGVRNDFSPDTGLEFFKDVPQSPFPCYSSCDVRSGGRSRAETPASPGPLRLASGPGWLSAGPGLPETPSHSVRNGCWFPVSHPR